MPEQPKNLETILTEALKKAGEQGFLEGVSEEELARMTIQARTKAAVTGTGALENASETTAQESWRKILLHPEEGKKVRDVLLFFWKINYGITGDDVGCWVVPDPRAWWQRAILDYFDLEPENVPNRVKMKLDRFEVVRPAESYDPTLGVSKKGLLRWKGPVDNS